MLTTIRFVLWILLTISVLVSTENTFAELTRNYRIEEIKWFATLIVRGTVIGKKEILIEEVYKGEVEKSKIIVHGLALFNNSGEEQKEESNGSFKKSNLIDEEVVLLLESNAGKYVLAGYHSYDGYNRPTGIAGREAALKVIRGIEVYSYLAPCSWILPPRELVRDPLTPTFADLEEAIRATDIVNKLQAIISLPNSSFRTTEDILLDFEIKYRDDGWGTRVETVSHANFSLSLKPNNEKETFFQIDSSALCMDDITDRQELSVDGEIYCKGTINICKCGFKGISGKGYLLRLNFNKSGRVLSNTAARHNILSSNSVSFQIERSTSQEKEPKAEESVELSNSDVISMEGHSKTHQQKTEVEQIERLPETDSNWLVPFTIIAAAVVVGLVIYLFIRRRK